MPDDQGVSADHDQNTLPPWRNKAVLKQWCLILAATLAVIGSAVFIGYPQVRDFRKKRILQSAKTFFAAEDYRSAYLLLDQFVREDPGNFEARRLLAQVLDHSNPEQALLEWESLARSEPGNATNFTGYATAALRAGQMEKLDEALATMQKHEPGRGDYFRLSAARALAKGDSAALRSAIEGLRRAEPDNEITQYNLVTLRFNSSIPAEVAQARAELEKFAQGDRWRIRATLALISEFPRRWPGEADRIKPYTRLARQLQLEQSHPGAFGARLTGDLIGRVEPGLPDLVEHMKNQPEPAPEDAARLALWMLEIRQGREALVWLETLDAKSRQAPAVLGAMATCAIGVESWSKLEQVLLQGAWGPVPPDAVKLAFRARALRRENNESKAERVWGNALLLSEESLAGLRMLQRLAQAWQWPANKQIQVLWVLVRHFPGDDLAWRKLSAQTLSVHDSAEVWRVYTAWSRAASTNTQVQIERIVLGLLARPNEPGLTGQAAELFRQHPDNPGSRLAQALALWRSHRTGEALALLDAGVLNYAAEPRLALARGLILASVGRREESETMLASVRTELLLPEEIALIADARAGRQ